MGSRAAAVVGGAFCGFAPGLVSQATAHPNLAGQFVLPFIAAAVLRLPGSTRPVRTGALLGLLVVYQAFLNEELLFLTALALGVLALMRRPGPVRPVAVGLGVAAAVAVPLLAYPLAVQFFGPQAYHGLPAWIDHYVADLAAYPGYAQQSVGGSVAGADPLAQGPTEQNAFFGWGLCLLVVLLVRWWRPVDRRVGPLGVLIAVFAVLSLGRVVVVRQHSSGVPGPWLALSRLPLFDSVVPTRLALVVTALVGVLLAIVLDRSRDRLTAALVAVALVPLVPVPLRTGPAEPTPRFFASGDWRRYLPAGGTVLVVPFGGEPALSAMRWQIGTDLGFTLVGGYFLGPEHGRTGDRARLGAPDSTTADVFTAHADWAHPVPPDPARLETVRAELRAWRVDAILLRDDQPDGDAVRSTVEQVVGPGDHVDDMWLWRLR